MERKVQNGSSYDVVLVIDSLKIMQSGFFYGDIFSVSLNRIEKWNSQSKDIQNAGFEQVLVLIFDSSLCCVEISQELSGRDFLFVLIVFLPLLCVSIIVRLIGL